MALGVVMCSLFDTGFESHLHMRTINAANWVSQNLVIPLPLPLPHQGNGVGSISAPLSGVHVRHVNTVRNCSPPSSLG